MAKVCMDKKEFNKEHKELGRILKTGTRAEQKKEAGKQERERKERK
jgi:hypothetical protein